MMIELDYPLVRGLDKCGVCGNRKPPQTLVCWMCYKENDMRHGMNPDVERLLERLENRAREELVRGEAETYNL